ncbi:hypothetical protein OHS33_39285 (plasmid) [Streptomyces sp. NBC_00536]|uniref:hypothetical protein n=1 Tax=Streptomyces sp. NBC_00536 TaxID=2975769 RepID=UPI002E809D91|nr:hypothetical protein [Streptomyces sp. NBC_00536]WUC84499.1 hypothetical protein OHS33_39285 [Streptomyces sp. NBC_00536]
MTAHKWTPDALQTSANRAIHLEQRRAQLHPIVDDLRRLAREMEAAVGEIDRLPGDLPGQASVRAWHAVRPLFKAADDVERALTDLIAFNARYQRSYEELPEKREANQEAKRQRKELAKSSQQQIEASPATETGSGGDKSRFDDVFNGLRKGA